MVGRGQGEEEGTGHRGGRQRRRVREIGRFQRDAVVEICWAWPIWTRAMRDEGRWTTKGFDVLRS
jgi:hypothetical protein